ncbi:hypothetical protein KY362_03610, partial [Candidatus Woesearchaeota archaeon]|nr:hypothetical protein [Candidatus Woesearchaeota archaeon]
PSGAPAEASAPRSFADVPITANENADIKRRVAEAIDWMGGQRPFNEQENYPRSCGDWLARIYKWSGYVYQYDRRDFNSLQELANAYGYPIGYNDNRGTAGHALILLGFGPEAEWWLQQFPDITTGRHARSISENEALVIGYTGSSVKEVRFGIYPRHRYPAYLVNRRDGPGREEPARIWKIHPWTPVCAGEYIQDSNGHRWSHDQAGGGYPWSMYWEPDSPYYPAGGRCP